jgi:hypothetical protein
VIFCVVHRIPKVMENLKTLHKKKENGKYPSGVSQSDKKWDEVRATFTKLYISDNKSLKEVRDILATTLGFYATSASIYLFTILF